MDFDILVLGSINMDLVVKAHRAPSAGETLSGEDFQMIPGGKGANQAAAIGRLGGSVAMVGRAGSADFGALLQENLASQGVDISQVRLTPDCPSGVALITVEAGGENRILVVPGANGRVSTSDVDEAEPLLRGAKMILTQYEIPLETVEYAAELANHYHIPFILNPAPYYPTSDLLLSRVFALVLNENEASRMSGMPIEDIPGALLAAEALNRRGAEAVILTLGADGAVLAQNQRSQHVPGYKVDPVDTTAAGDAFIGGFAVSYLESHDILRSVGFANATGAMAVTKFGAQTSIPYRAEVEIFRLTHPPQKAVS